MKEEALVRELRALLEALVPSSQEPRGTAAAPRSARSERAVESPAGAVRIGDLGDGFDG